MIKKTICLFITLLFLTCTSCSRSNIKKDIIIQRDCAAFTAIELDWVGEDNSSEMTKDVCLVGSNIVYLRQVSDEKGQVVSYKLVWTDLTGEMQKTQVISIPDDTFYGISLISLGENIAVQGTTQKSGPVILEYASDNSQPTVTFLPVNAYILDAAFLDGAWVLFSNNSLITIREGKEVSKQKIPGDVATEQVFVGEEGVSVLYGENQEIYIGTLNADTGSFDAKSTGIRENLIALTGVCYSQNGTYIKTTDGISECDAKAGNIREILSWNDTDLPPSSYVYNITKDYVLSEDLIIRVVSPVGLNQQEEIILLKHSQTNPNEGKTVLTIGGYGVSVDPVIQYAAYQFNTTNNEYRIKIVDYQEIYPLTDDASYTIAKASMLSDMSSGKSQDILYGNDLFDFPELGKSGVVIDMMPYLNADKDISPDDWVASVFNLMKSGDSLYSIFPSFVMNGYITNKDALDTEGNVTVDMMNEQFAKLEQGETLLENSMSSELVSVVIQFGLDDFCDDSGKFSITAEQLSEIIQYAQENGNPDNYVGGVNDREQYITKKTAMIPAYIYCPQDYESYEKLNSSEMVYVGYPSIYESKRVLAPLRMMGISAGSNYPDACWEFIKIMMSDEVQQKCIEINSIPVSTVAFESIINKAMHPELRTAEENTALDLTSKTAVSEESIRRFREAVASLNYIYYYDFDLAKIINEESAPCLSGDKSPGEMATILNSRINLYLEQ